MTQTLTDLGTWSSRAADQVADLAALRIRLAAAPIQPTASGVRTVTVVIGTGAPVVPPRRTGVVSVGGRGAAESFTVLPWVHSSAPGDRLRTINPDSGVGHR